MSYNFVKHTLTGRRIEYRITITKGGHIGFPSGFYHDNKINRFSYATLFYDQDKKAIGISFSYAKEEGSISISTHSNEKYGGYISATSFFKGSGLSPEQHRGRYEYKKIGMQEAGLGGTGKLFIISLKDEDKDEEAF